MNELREKIRTILVNHSDNKRANDKIENDIFELIQSQPINKELDTWISVKERLPKKYCQVLAYSPSDFPKNCRFQSANYYDDCELFYSDSSEEVIENVTHWMEINEPCIESLTNKTDEQ